MRNTYRIAAVTGAVLATLATGAGIAAAQEPDVCAQGDDGLVNAQVLSCTDVANDLVDNTLSDVLDDSVNDLLDVTDALNDAVDDLSVLGD